MAPKTSMFTNQKGKRGMIILTILYGLLFWLVFGILAAFIFVNLLHISLDGEMMNSISMSMLILSLVISFFLVAKKKLPGTKFLKSKVKK
jgi:asparagine N-glycosylation enzyme membrane subunit Stt3